ncbi:MAG: molybdopterin-guanine dinucleotide biosynthesis protein B [Ideonella sp.]|nr:molybdopterin-guanine dinucleotide biosynthesis protein B [Ideonella sp.]MCC7456049.1 molybdopterin-guanine dinucleotide biosynthesis protein B [Nitrospira sp.]
MKVVGFCGPSGSGKTTLIEQLLPRLRGHGTRVSVIKHAHSGFDIDTPGKDSWRHREAGAFEVLLASDSRLVKMREYEVQGHPSVHQLIAELVDCDWVLVEGFKHADILKIELYDPARGAAPQYPDDPYVVALVTDAAPPVPTQRPVFARGDVEGLAQFLAEQAARHEYRFDPPA